MPSKKKAKPSYSVPEDLQETPQSGWVYRSGSPEPESAPSPASASAEKAPAVSAPPAPAAPEAPAPKTDQKKSSNSRSVTSEIIDLAGKTLSSSAAAVGNALLLGARLVMAPVSIGMKMIGLRK